MHLHITPTLERSRPPPIPPSMEISIPCHPWLTTNAHRKRKHVPTLDDTPHASDSSRTPSPPIKKSRHHALENGLASLSIGYPVHHNVGRGHMFGPTAAVDPMHVAGPSQYPSLPPKLPSPQEEEPESPEVHMKSSSWYEPEKDREYCLPLLSVHVSYIVL